MLADAENMWQVPLKPGKYNALNIANDTSLIVDVCNVDVLS